VRIWPVLAPIPPGTASDRPSMAGATPKLCITGYKIKRSMNISCILKT
jgi:hypothetical protein